RDLREDRGGSDRGRAPIARDDSALGTGHARDPEVAIDEDQSGWNAKPRERRPHRVPGRLEHVDHVDAAWADLSDRERERVESDLARETPPLPAAEELGVAKPVDRGRRVEDHRGGDDRPGEGPAPHLGTASHPAPAAPQAALLRVEVLFELEQPLLQWTRALPTHSEGMLAQHALRMPAAPRKRGRRLLAALGGRGGARNVLSLLAESRRLPRALAQVVELR